MIREQTAENSVSTQLWHHGTLNGNEWRKSDEIEHRQKRFRGTVSTKLTTAHSPVLDMVCGAVKDRWGLGRRNVTDIFFAFTKGSFGRDIFR